MTRIRLEYHGHVAYITLDHPPANTWTLASLQAFLQMMVELDSRPDVVALVIRGAGDKFFCAGADLKMFADGNPEHAREVAEAFGRMFAGGASLYGVSDPLSLRRSTHKFEGDYLDWLLGDPQQHAERYQARTPLLHSERIVAPLIFFQGGLDAVVLPAQTERMVAALRGRGVAVEYHCYADERHGFRQAAHLAHALEAELGFFRSLLSS